MSQSYTHTIVPMLARLTTLFFLSHYKTYKTTSHGSFGRDLLRSSARINRDGSTAPVYKGYGHKNTTAAHVKKPFLPLQRGQRKLLHRVSSIAELNFPKEVLREVDALKILSRVTFLSNCLQKCLSLSQSPRSF